MYCLKASIVLPNLNGAGWLRPCLESLLAQTEQDFELIIVDNGSTDESLTTAREYAAQPRVSLIENSGNTGFAAAVNQGIRAAKAPYVLLFNNDAFARPDMLAQLLANMEQNPRIFGLQCLMLRHYEPQRADDAGDFVTLFGWAFKRGDGLAAKRYLPRDSKQARAGSGTAAGSHTPPMSSAAPSATPGSLAHTAAHTAATNGPGVDVDTTRPIPPGGVTPDTSVTGGWPGEGPAPIHLETRRIFSCCGGATMYRRQALLDLGLFEEHFFAYLEDVDLSWRAANRGWQNHLCPAAQCSHIAGATTGGAKGARYNNFKSIQSGRNSLLLPYKNLPLLFLLLDFPFLLFGYLVKTLVFHLRGYGKPWRQGMRQAFALLKPARRGGIEKPPFRLRCLGHYLRVQCSLVAGTFRYVHYRVLRLFSA